MDTLEYLKWIYAGVQTGKAKLIVTALAESHKVPVMIRLADFEMDQLERAAAFIHNRDCFIKVNPIDLAASIADKQKEGKSGSSAVGGVDHVCWVVGIQLDVDAAKTKAYATREQTLQALSNMPVEPTMILNTQGPAGGFHVYWSFDQPVPITSENRRFYASLADRWNEELRIKVREFNPRHRLDSTANLDRVLRPVGSIRTETGNEVTVHSFSGKRYDPDEFKLPQLESRVFVPQQRFDEHSSVIEQYLRSTGLETVGDILEARGYEFRGNDREEIYARPGYTLSPRTGKVYWHPEYGEGFTVYSANAEPLDCRNPKFGTGNWYGKAALFATFESGLDCSNCRNTDAFRRVAKWCRAQLEFADGERQDEPAKLTFDDLVRKKTYDLSVSILDMLADPSIPKIQEPIIEGVCRRGEVLMIGSTSKAGKSMLTANLVYSLVSGEPFLGMPTTPGPVLLIDYELYRSELNRRFDELRASVFYPDNLERAKVWSFRGDRHDILDVRDMLEDLDLTGYSAIVIDPFYQTYLDGMDENNNSHMARMMSHLQEIAGEKDVMVCCIHHAPKGDVSQRSVLDLFSGAGAIGRALDAAIGIREHEDPDLAIIEFKTRSFANPDMLSARFDWPLWTVVDAPAVKLDRRKRPKNIQDWDGYAETSNAIIEMLNLVQDGDWVCFGITQILQGVGSVLDIGRKRLQTVIDSMVTEGALRKVDQGSKRTVYQLCKELPVHLDGHML